MMRDWSYLRLPGGGTERSRLSITDGGIFLMSCKKNQKKKQETEIVRLKTNKLTTAQHRKLCHTHDTLWTLSNKNSVTKRMMNLKEKWNVGESKDKVTSHWGRSEINSFQKTSETFTESCLGLIDFFFLELTYEINS